MKAFVGYIVLILFVMLIPSNAQSINRIKGKVVSEESNKGIEKVSISIDGGLNFTYTDSIGNFQLNLDKNVRMISISKFGFYPVKIPITIDSNNLYITLKEKQLTKNDSIALFSDDVSDEEVEAFLTKEYSTEDRAMVEETRPLKIRDRAEVKKLSAGISDATAPASGDLSGFYPEPIHFENNNNASAGLLTAGEVNDFSKWILWNDISEYDLSEFKDHWKFYPQQRYTVQIENKFRAPVFGAKVYLLEDGYVIWSSVTDNTGKAELWKNAFSNHLNQNDITTIEIEYENNFYSINSAKEFSQGINFISIDTECNRPKTADIMFLVDATGSMGDEIRYLKKDLLSIMDKIQDTLPSIDFNLASVFYRDTMDTYITKKSDFNSDFNITSQFINNNNAGGGGDYPEAVHRGLDVAVNHLSWRENSMTKVIFLLLDAPPHDTTYNQLQALTFKASEKGIRIIPVGCSGINKSTEYIMRAMALLTNGTYTFLTDDSGIGNPHIKPSTDTFKVETFNELIVRLIYQYTFYPDCNTYYPLLTNDTLDVRLPETGNMQSDNEQLLNSFRYYPNPTFGQINIELSNTAEELFIADISGKIIFRITPNGKTNLLVNLSEFTSGIYFLMYQYAPDKWIKGKIVLMH